ncbi:unnamed protein product [Moneuplotes crassus]|uniref:Uncharacterized protein n=1 Tax=Euplotes crassus TaxID=5936 RepID=A0AAD1UQE2_EUPCR|nr:unnamed protein product [Moneuplotes crassus]
MEKFNKEDANNHLVNLERALLKQGKYVDCLIQQSIYHNALSKDLDIEKPDSDSETSFEIGNLDWDFEAYEVSCLIKKLKNFTILNTKDFDLGYIEGKDNLSNKFLSSSFPDKVNRLWVEGLFESSLNINNFFHRIMKISAKVCNEVKFCGFYIRGDHLSRLIISFRHIKSFLFKCCKLSTPSVLDYSKALRGTQIQEINFHGSGMIVLSDWYNKPLEFKNLIEGLSTSQDLQYSLKEIGIAYCEICVDTTRKLLDQNGFEKVQLIQN